MGTRARSPASPLAMMFPGQGTQRQGMGAAWQHAPSWSVVAEISEWAGQDLDDLLLHTDEVALRRTDRAQLAVFTVSIVAFLELRRLGVGPVAVYAGHSLGEYTALVAAGALSLRDGVTLVMARGAAMREAAERRSGRMIVVLGGDTATVEDLVDAARARGHEVWLANVNAPGQVTVSGTEAGVGAVRALAGFAGLTTAPLPVAGAFHSALMEEAVPALRRALAAVRFRDDHVPVVANLDARLHLGGDDWADLEARQLTSPVLWQDTLVVLTRDLGCRLVEVGPGRALARMAGRVSPWADVVSVTTMAEAEELSGPWRRVHA